MTTDMTNEKSPSVMSLSGSDTTLSMVPRMRLTTASTTAKSSAEMYPLVNVMPPTILD